LQEIAALFSFRAIHIQVGGFLSRSFWIRLYADWFCTFDCLRRERYELKKYFSKKIDINLDYIKWWYSPKYADLDKTEIDVKESEIGSFEMIKQFF
jgi:hypothetical protein